MSTATAKSSKATERRVLTLTRTEWLSALHRCNAIVPTRGSLPVLFHAHVHGHGHGDQVTFTATNLDATIRVTVPGEAPDPIPVLVPSKRLADAIALYPNAPIVMTATDNRVALMAGRARAEFVTVPASEFPEMPALAGDPVLAIGGAVLATAILRAQPHASSEESRPILNGILLECDAQGVRLVATDGHSIAVVPLNAMPHPDARYIIPATLATTIAKTFEHCEEVELRASGPQLQFDAPGLSLTVRQLEGPYPDYRLVIQREQDKRATVDVDELVRTVRRALVNAESETGRIRCTWSADRLAVHTQTTDVGASDDALPVTYEGEEAFVIGVSGKLLLRALASIPGEAVTLHMSSRERAILITPADDANAAIRPFALVMPMRILD